MFRLGITKGLARQDFSHPFLPLAGPIRPLSILALSSQQF
jgi:hypothetical protein